MNLIDRDLLVDEDGLFAQRGCCGNCQRCSLWSENGCRVILEAPTVEAKPVVHACWLSYLDGDHIEPDVYFKCSKCGSRGHELRWRYCPSCGSIMDSRK